MSLSLKINLKGHEVVQRVETEGKTFLQHKMIVIFSFRIVLPLRALKFIEVRREILSLV